MGSDQSDTLAFFEKVRLLDAHRIEIDRAQLLAALGGVLERAGHVRLVQATPNAAKSDLSGLAVPVLFWGLGASIGVAAGLAPWLWILLALGILLAYGMLASAAPKLSGPAAALLMVAWVGAAIGLAFVDPQDLLWTHGIPVAGAVIIALGLRTLRVRDARDVAAALAGVVRAAPYVAPVVLVAVLLPALTADVWQLAAGTGSANLAGAAALSVGVLVVLVARQLQRELEPAFAARCRALAGRATAPEMTRGALVAALDEDTAGIVREIPAETLASIWPATGDEYAPYLVAAEGSSLRRPLAARLLITAGSVGVLLAIYIYALLAVTVPRSIATDWSQSTIHLSELRALGITVHLPGGAYVAMAALLGIFATAIFLAFALTEERIAAAITEALLREPIDRFLLLALPFVSLIEGELEAQPSAPEDATDEPGDGLDSSGSGAVSS